MTTEEYAIKRGIWHWYTVNGTARYYRVQTVTPQSEYHGIIYEREAPWNNKDVKLFGYDSDSVYDKLSFSANKKGNRKLLTTGVHGKSIVISKPSKVAAIARGVRCCYCEVILTDRTFTEEHLIPSSHRGGNSHHNKRPACVRCNKERADMTMIEYIEFLSSVPQNDRVKKSIENAYALESYIIKNRARLLKKHGPHSVNPISSASPKSQPKDQ